LLGLTIVGTLVLAKRRIKKWVGYSL
jgi:hypothetical protein